MSFSDRGSISLKYYNKSFTKPWNFEKSRKNKCNYETKNRKILRALPTHLSVANGYHQFSFYVVTGNHTCLDISSPFLKTISLQEDTARIILESLENNLLESSSWGLLGNLQKYVISLRRQTPSKSLRPNQLQEIQITFIEDLENKITGCYILIFFGLFSTFLAIFFPFLLV